jgi:prolyl oligopeptidase
VDQRGGLQTDDELADALRFATLQDYEDWLARLRGFPAYADQTMDLLREGVARGVVQPRVTMQRVPAQIEKQLADDPAQSPFYKPFRSVEIVGEYQPLGSGFDYRRLGVVPKPVSACK